MAQHDRLGSPRGIVRVREAPTHERLDTEERNWYQQSGRPIVRIRATRLLTKTLSQLDKTGWGDDARTLVDYCTAMPAFGKDQGAALMRRQCEARITELEAATAG